MDDIQNARGIADVLSEILNALDLRSSEVRCFIFASSDSWNLMVIIIVESTKITKAPGSIMHSCFKMMNSMMIWRNLLTIAMLVCQNCFIDT